MFTILRQTKPVLRAERDYPKCPKDYGIAAPGSSIRWAGVIYFSSRKLMSRPNLFLSLPWDAWTYFISIQNAIFCQHVIPSEILTNESVTSIILRYSIILSSEIILGVLQPSFWDNKVKIAESYFDMIGPEKPTKNQAEKLPVATVTSLCFLILIPLIQGVIHFKNS